MALEGEVSLGMRAGEHDREYSVAATWLSQLRRKAAMRC
jgi:hypothetical protein